MRRSSVDTLRHATVACALGLLTLAASAEARQAGETLSADASVKSAGGVKATAPVVVTIKRYSTDGERDALLAALKKGGTESARALLVKRDDLGTVQIGARQTPIKHAYARSTGAGRLITVVTAEPMVFLGGGVPDAKPKTGFDLGLVLLDTAASGPGRGELVPATKIRLNADGAIVTEDYSGDVVVLSNVTRK
jgi:hypothetical protein